MDSNAKSDPPPSKRRRLMLSPQPEGVEVNEEAKENLGENRDMAERDSDDGTKTGKSTWIDQSILMMYFEEVPFRPSNHRYYILYTQSKEDTSGISDCRLRETSLYLRFLSRLVDSEGGQRTAPYSSIVIGNYVLYGKLIYNSTNYEKKDMDKRSVSAPHSSTTALNAAREIRTLLRSTKKRVLALAFNSIQNWTESSLKMSRHVWAVLFEWDADSKGDKYRIHSYDSELRDELDFERMSRNCLRIEEEFGKKCTYQNVYNNMDINARMPNGDALDKAYWYLCRFLEFQNDPNISFP